MSIDYRKLVTSTYDSLIRFPELTSNALSLSMLEKGLLGHLILLGRPHAIVELGVDEALSTQFMCEFLEMNNLPGTVFGLDLPEQIVLLRQRSRKINRFESLGRLTLVPGMLPGSLRDWLKEPNRQVDLALVDATHNYWSVSGELDLLWSALAPDGYIVCHDYSPSYQGVREAVDYFVSRHHDAMAVPLVSVDTSLNNDCRSSLIVLRRRPYTFQKRNIFLTYQWRQYREKLKRTWLIGFVWALVRPLFKHHS